MLRRGLLCGLNRFHWSLERINWSQVKATLGLITLISSGNRFRKGHNFFRGHRQSSFLNLHSLRHYRLLLTRSLLPSQAHLSRALTILTLALDFSLKRSFFRLQQALMSSLMLNQQTVRLEIHNRCHLAPLSQPAQLNPVDSEGTRVSSRSKKPTVQSGLGFESSNLR